MRRVGSNSKPTISLIIIMMFQLKLWKLIEKCEDTESGEKERKDSKNEVKFQVL